MSAEPLPGSPGPPPVLEARGISKNYGRVRALHRVDLAIRAGEIVGLVGDNGAGKSTLVKIFSGALLPSEGAVWLDGRPLALHSPVDARARGIETVYQDLALALHLSIAANLYLGREMTVRDPRRWFGWLDRRAMEDHAREELRRLRITIASTATPCDALSGGQRQAVAVARGVAWGTKVLLLDEPTANLGVEEQHQVGELIRQVREQGIPALLISHNLPQVHELADRIVVLRQGRVATVLSAGVPAEETIRWITGALSGDGAGRRSPGAG